jgi:hypothetical protein
VIGVGGASCGVNNFVQTERRHPFEVKSLVMLSGGTNLTGRQFLQRASRLPALFSVADDDAFPPTVEIMPWLFNICSNPSKKYVHYTSGGHGADMFAVHPELRGAIVDWYVTTLIKRPAAPRLTRAVGPLRHQHKFFAKSRGIDIPAPKHDDDQKRDKPAGPLRNVRFRYACVIVTSLSC